MARRETSLLTDASRRDLPSVQAQRSLTLLCTDIADTSRNQILPPGHGRPQAARAFLWAGRLRAVHQEKAEPSSPPFEAQRSSWHALGLLAVAKRESHRSARSAKRTKWRVARLVDLAEQDLPEADVPAAARARQDTQALIGEGFANENSCAFQAQKPSSIHELDVAWAPFDTKQRTRILS